MKGGAYWIGGAHYIKNIIQATYDFAIQNDIKLSINLLIRDDADLIFFDDIKHKIENIYIENLVLKPFNILNRTKWFLKRKFSSIFNPRLDEFIISKNFDFVYPSMPRKDFKFYRFAEWIPDFQYHHYPNGSNLEEINGRINEFKFICDNAPLVYLSSFHAEKDCHKLFPKSIGKTEVMQFTAFQEPKKLKNSFDDIIRKYSIKQPFFIVSNLLAPTKNHEVILDALKILKELNFNITVVSTGDLHDYRNPTFKNEILNKINEFDLRENFILTGLIPRDEQKMLMLNSIAIIQPSKFEGWNTSVEEAKSIGKLIVLSDIEVHLEQNPEKSIFFKDNNAKDLAEKLLIAFKANTSTKDTYDKIEMTEKYIINIHSFAKHFLEKSLL